MIWKCYHISWKRYRIKNVFSYMFVNALKYSRKISLNGGIRYLSNIMDNDSNSTATTAWKVYKYGVSLRILSECGKIRTRKKLLTQWKFFLTCLFFGCLFIFCLSNYGIIHRSNHHRCSMKKDVLRNLAKFTGKHLCQSLFLNKAAGLRQWFWLKLDLWNQNLKLEEEVPGGVL